MDKQTNKTTLGVSIRTNYITWYWDRILHGWSIGTNCIIGMLLVYYPHTSLRPQHEKQTHKMWREGDPNKKFNQTWNKYTKEIWISAAIKKKPQVHCYITVVWFIQQKPTERIENMLHLRKIDWKSGDIFFSLWNLEIYGGVVAWKLDIWYERLLQGSSQRFRRFYTIPKQYHPQ